MEVTCQGFKGCTKKGIQHNILNGHGSSTNRENGEKSGFFAKLKFLENFEDGVLCHY